MKCITCKKNKTQLEFSWHTRDKRRSGTCKVCVNNRTKQYYYSLTPKQHLERKRKTNKRRENRQLWLSAYKETQQCQICDFDDSRALCFHHRNPNDKCFTIGSSQDSSLAKLRKEISKCDVLCANCHSILHTTFRN